MYQIDDYLAVDENAATSSGQIEIINAVEMQQGMLVKMTNMMKMKSSQKLDWQMHTQHFEYMACRCRTMPWKTSQISVRMSFWD